MRRRELPSQDGVERAYVEPMRTAYRIRDGLRTTDFGHRLRTTDYGLRTTDYRLQATVCGLRFWIQGHRRSTAQSRATHLLEGSRHGAHRAQGSIASAHAMRRTRA